MNSKWEKYHADNFIPKNKQSKISTKNRWEKYHADNFSNTKENIQQEHNDINAGESLNNTFENYMKGGKHLGKNILLGLTEAGRGIANTPHNLANLIGLGKYVPGAPEINFEKAYGLEGEPSLSDKIVRSLAQFAPAIAMPGMALGKAGEAISSIPRVGSFLSEAASQAVPQALYGATQNENPLAGAAEGGIGSVAGSLIGKGIGKGINALRPSQRYQSPLTKKELAKSFQQAVGTNTDLGNVIQNPKLQRAYENVLPKITGEASLMQQKTGKQIVDKGEELLKKMLGDNPSETVPEQITKKLTDAFYKHQNFKNTIYNTVDDLAEKEGLKLNLSSFSDEAKKYMAAIEDTNILKHEPDAKQILNKLVNYKNPVKETTTQGKIVDKSGKPILEETTITYPTLKEANILKGKLGQYAKNFAQSSDPSQRNMARIFKDLSKKLKSDINNSIEQSGNDILKQGYKTAEENYAKNFSPFLDKDIYKFISGNADPQTIISKFITNSKSSDLSSKLSKLAEKVSTQSKAPGSGQSNLLAYGYLARALDNEGSFNPSKFATLIKNLGSNQLKALFPDKALRKEVMNYKSLVNKNTRSLNVMFNPLTGQVNTDIAPNALAATLGAVGGAISGGTVGSIIGAPLAIYTKKKIADFATKKLTDPVYRRKFINALIAGKEFELPKTTKALEKAGAISSQYHERKPLEIEVVGKN